VQGFQNAHATSAGDTAADTPLSSVAAVKEKLAAADRDLKLAGSSLLFINEMMNDTIAYPLIREKKGRIAILPIAFLKNYFAYETRIQRQHKGKSKTG